MLNTCFSSARSLQMPPVPKPPPSVLKLSRGQQVLRVAAALADGQQVYVGFEDDQPRVVGASPGESLRALLWIVRLPQRRASGARSIVQERGD